MHNIYLLLALFLFIGPRVVNADQDFLVVEQCNIYQPNVNNIERYDNYCSDDGMVGMNFWGSYIKINIFDMLTEQKGIIVVPISAYARYIAYEKGLANISGDYKSNFNTSKFNSRFTALMKEYEGKLHFINYQSLQKSLKKQCIENYVVNNELSLKELGVNDINSFIDMYFDVVGCKAYLKKTYKEKYYYDPALKSLLINIGYDVCIEDFVGVWFISPCPITKLKYIEKQKYIQNLKDNKSK